MFKKQLDLQGSVQVKSTPVAEQQGVFAENHAMAADLI